MAALGIGEHANGTNDVLNDALARGAVETPSFGLSR